MPARPVKNPPLVRHPYGPQGVDQHGKDARFRKDRPRGVRAARVDALLDASGAPSPTPPRAGVLQTRGAFPLEGAGVDSEAFVAWHRSSLRDVQVSPYDAPPPVLPRREVLIGSYLRVFAADVFSPD